MLLLKLLASILIVSSSSLIGLEMSQKLKERVILLKDLKSSLSMLQTEIQFTMTPLPEALENIATRLHGSLKDFYTFAAYKLLEHNGMTVEVVFEEGIQSILHRSNFKDEDLEIIFHLSKSLGSSDLEGQMRMILLASECVEGNMRKAVEIQQQNEKIYKVLGMLAGLAIVVVLF